MKSSTIYKAKLISIVYFCFDEKILRNHSSQHRNFTAQSFVYFENKKRHYKISCSLQYEALNNDQMRCRSTLLLLLYLLY